MICCWGRWLAQCTVLRVASSILLCSQLLYVKASLIVPGCGLCGFPWAVPWVGLVIVPWCGLVSFGIPGCGLVFLCPGCGFGCMWLVSLLACM